jgi:hypothetical protein
MTELCGRPSAVFHESTMKDESAAARCPKTSAVARMMTQKWIRLFKLAGAYALAAGGKRFFKNACGWHGMGYVFIALENGRSVFPVERRSGRAGEKTVCNAGPFYFQWFCRTSLQDRNNV